ncbi:hypothetical protein GN316_13225 [Xylophilus sp. Kf1]|nr:hypothetical protein [Xylophilus sp. Kf1]
MKTSDFPRAPGASATDDAIALMREVCVLANTAMRLSRDRLGLIDDEYEDDLADRLQLMRQAVGRMGWVADVALRKLGDPGAFATAEDWMLTGA